MEGKSRLKEIRNLLVFKLLTPFIPIFYAILGYLSLVSYLNLNPVHNDYHGNSKAFALFGLLVTLISVILYIAINFKILLRSNYQSKNLSEYSNSSKVSLSVLLFSILVYPILTFNTNSSSGVYYYHYELPNVLTFVVSGIIFFGLFVSYLMAIPLLIKANNDLLFKESNKFKKILLLIIIFTCTAFGLIALNQYIRYQYMKIDNDDLSQIYQIGDEVTYSRRTLTLVSTNLLSRDGKQLLKANIVHNKNPNESHLEGYRVSELCSLRYLNKNGDKVENQIASAIVGDKKMLISDIAPGDILYQDTVYHLYTNEPKEIALEYEVEDGARDYILYCGLSWESDDYIKFRVID